MNLLLDNVIHTLSPERVFLELIDFVVIDIKQLIVSENPYSIRKYLT